MDNSDLLALIVGSAVAVGFLGIVLYLPFKVLRQRFRISGMPTRTIASCRDGETVKVNGTVRSLRPDPAKAPFSGRPCVFWRIRVLSSNGVDEPSSPHYWSIASADEFLIVDPTGAVAVKGDECNPSGPTAWIDADSGSLRLIQELFPSLKPDEREALETWSTSYAELVVLESAEVTVVGLIEGTREPIGGSYREAPTVVRTMHPPPGGTLLLFTEPI